ncbi:hypothetical protein KJ854_01380 [Patescibacteria group bacterium]|nr:hypothetical protein [Patescibacteria group bacterium]MBU4142085.1 hypothetical protein [Patescibacteria group bacterium]
MTTLSNKELEIIEKLVVKYGNIVVFDMIFEIVGKNKSKQEIKNFVTNLVRKGWFVRIKKGTFVISDISSRGTTELSQLAIAQIINNDSYVSLEAALQYYGLFDQYLKVITSIGKKRTYNKKFSNWIFKYIKAKKNLLNFHKEYNIDGRLVKVALKEQAILDFLIYRRTVNNIDLVIEKLETYKNDFDLRRFIEISKKCTVTVVRTLGFIFDLVGINSDELYNSVKKNKNHSFMTSGAEVFNAKWRIYTDKHFKNNYGAKQ